MNLPPHRKEEFHSALLNAYRSMPELERMLSFKLGVRMQELVSPGPLRRVVFELLDWAESEDQVDQLVAGAHIHNPGNELLRRFYKEHFALVQPQEISGLESIIFPNNQFQDIAHWRARLQEIENRVCIVGITGYGAGTGFLIADDVVITNDHVICEVREKKLPPERIHCTFDFKRGEDGIHMPSPVTYTLESDWLIDSSPKELLDYALLRVAKRPGNELKDGVRRGFIPVPRTARPLTPQMPLIIVQHPRDELGLEKAQPQPLKIAIDTQAVMEVNADATRVSYRTNTLPGSSGSPCFNMDLELVALHKGTKGTGFNQGIPMATIRAHLEKKELLHVLGKVS